MFSRDIYHVYHSLVDIGHVFRKNILFMRPLRSQMRCL